MQIVSSTNNNVTVKAINSSVNGEAYIRILIDNQTIYKRISIGKPKITTRLEPNSNYVSVHLIGANNTNIHNQGITNTTWQKVSSNGQCYAAFNGSGFEGLGHGNCYNWSVQIKITATNACGTTTIYRTIVPPPAPPCDDNYRFVQNPMKSGSYVNRVIIEPCDDNYRKSSVNKSKDYTINIHNNYGKKVYSKTQSGIDFDISSLKKGFYIVRFQAKSGKTISKKLIIE